MTTKKKNSTKKKDKKKKDKSNSLFDLQRKTLQSESFFYYLITFSDSLEYEYEFKNKKNEYSKL